MLLTDQCCGRRRVLLDRIEQAFRLLEQLVILPRLDLDQLFLHHGLAGTRSRTSSSCATSTLPYLRWIRPFSPV